MASENSPAAHPATSPVETSASMNNDIPASNEDSSKIDHTVDESPAESASRIVDKDEKSPDEPSHGQPDEEQSSPGNEESSTHTNGKSSHFSPVHTATSTRRASKRIKIRRKSRPTPKIFFDAVTVVIPLNVTADLKLAMQHTRNKRIQSIYKRFPTLKKAAKTWKNQHSSQDDDNNSKADDAMDEDDEAAKDPNAEPSKVDGKENNKPNKKKKKILAHVPQPEQYGSVLDYLEAKYVRGVMLGDEEADGESMDDKSEGQGSVYSQGSFLDDTDLQRDVAEQVMANTTLTKLELEDEEGEFFVNVGALEVEDNQYGDNYDPLQDKEASKPAKKRKKSQSTDTTDVNKTSIKKKKTKGGEEDTLAQSSKSNKSVTSTGTVKKKPGRKTKNEEVSTDTSPVDQEEEEEEEQSEEQKEAIAKAKKTRAKSDAMFKKLAALVKTMSAEDLPRRKTKAKVTLTCPSNKKPGDDVTFTNPHNKGQRLRVKIPKDCLPGGVFKVSVPVKQDPGDELDDKDHNNFSRDFQELVDDYARGYDVWCSAQSDVDKKFALLKEKQAKFDPLVELFPKNLMTPVNVEYMKKIVRRARQNRHKREKTAALKSETSTKDDDDDDDNSEKEDVEEKGKEEEKAPEPQKRVVEIPTMGSVFPTVRWDEANFQ